jgi:hypothetical protein
VLNKFLTGLGIIRLQDAIKRGIVLFALGLAVGQSRDLVQGGHARFPRQIARA